MVGSAYQCSCVNGFTGVDCENAPCIGHNCLNGGTAVYNTTTEACQCSCLEGFAGDFCEYNFPGVCEPNPPCGEHGTCVEITSEIYDCACEFGYQELVHNFFLVKWQFKIYNLCEIIALCSKKEKSYLSRVSTTPRLVL